MSATGRVQAQIFNTYDGTQGAQRLFDHVRERAYTGATYPPAAVSGDLPVDTEADGISAETANTNIKHYATLYSEISRSLTGLAEVIKRQVDIAEPRSGYTLLRRLRESAGLNTRINSATKLQIFLDIKMCDNKDYKTLKHFLDFFV